MIAAQHRRASVITVLNLKGGVGKTHAVWLLASVCQERSLRLLAFDTDTQANFSTSFLPDPRAGKGVDLLFHPGAEIESHALVRRSAYSHIDIIPPGASLPRFDLTDQGEWEQADLHLSLVDAVEQLRATYDFIVFDCPPRLSLVSFAALCASDRVIIPLEAADWGAQGIMQVTAAIRHVQQQFNPRLHLLGYLVSRFRRARSYQQSYMKQLRKHFGSLAFDTVIPDLAQFEKSVTDRIPITLHAPSSEEAGIARQFFDEVASRIEGLHGGSTARRGQILHGRAVTAAQS
jgi:chromosome partitioning protein